MDRFIGKIFERIDHMKRERRGEGDELRFICADGSGFRMYHGQDCCESVTIDDITGDLSSLIGTPIIEAEESSNSDNPPVSESGYAPDSFTWTFYKFRTAKVDVTIRWYGESNGYYGESVDVEPIEPSN